MRRNGVKQVDNKSKTSPILVEKKEDKMVSILSSNTFAILEGQNDEAERKEFPLVIKSPEAMNPSLKPKPKAQAQSIRLYFKGPRQTKPSRSTVTETRRNGHRAITQAQHKVNPFNSNCTCDDVPWDPLEWLKSGSQNCHMYEAFFSSFGTVLEALMECLPIQKAQYSMPLSLLKKQLVSFINLQSWQIYHDHICCNTSYDEKGDKEDKARANEAKGAAIATKAATTQEQRSPQPNTPIVLVHLQHRTQEGQFGGRGINALNFVGLP
uniref:Uncharacterized protein n=1 Tax=Fagus sylvatica TaxID=28930 RepID=A0A2N9J7Z7_FAGSY